ncbi:MAG: right-handed parallel beta-helix repeat-containing protein [Armatimonadota bacterium]
MMRIALITVLAVIAGTCHAQEALLPLTNPFFEDGLEGWEITSNPDWISISDEQAARGTRSLKIVDDSAEQSARIYASPVAVEGPAIYLVRGKYFPVSGSGLGVYHDFLDAEGNILNDERHIRGLGGAEQEWLDFEFRLFAPREAEALRIYFHSYSHARVTAYIDDLQIAEMDAAAMRPPWEGSYKLTADDELTDADVLGPDGIVYPDWTRAGVQGGIADVPVVARIEEFGGVADDDADDSEALDAACRHVGDQGGGAVLLGEGTWHLDMPVTVRHDGVVIRGMGADRTNVVFRYGVGDDGIRFFTPEAGATVGRNTRIELHAAPTDLQRMTMHIGHTLVGAWTRSQHSGNTFSFARTAARVADDLDDGPATLRGAAEYADGSTRETEIPITVDRDFRDDPQAPASHLAIGFVGPGRQGPHRPLAEDGERGATQIVLEDAGDLQSGDVVFIEGPATDRWKELTRNACRWGSYRRNIIEVAAVEGNTLTLDQPLRIEFPVIDGSYVQRFVPIRRCGIEDLSIEQTENLWITTSQFQNAWNCWARGVTVRMCGRNPIYGSLAKFCEIRDCVFDDAWFKGGGGTAYVGWENSFDSLMEDVETFRMRHAPLVQWAASGNVIRNSVFHESDAQWHSGWTNENLFENCVITSVRGHGGYGYGMWASPPEDTAHGPNGPRNVVYNCDVISERDAVWMGGMNENWLILHNRFIVESGEGVEAKDASFDHIISGNVFALRDETSPMVRLRTPDCIGVEIIDNALYGGGGEFASGMGEPEIVEGNTVHPLPEGDDLPARPAPPVESIYQWQLDNAR